MDTPSDFATPEPPPRCRLRPIVACWPAPALAAALTVMPVLAQIDQPAPTLMETTTVRLVLLPVSATRRGRPVTGLEREEFTIVESGQEREIKVFATDTDVPVSLAFLLDLSGSMRQGGKLDRAKAAVSKIVDGLADDDRVGLIGFADERVDWITEFTSDRQTFLARLAVQEGLGPTALWDALGAAPGLVEDERPGRKAIVLITDGVDNASAMPMLHAVWLARRVQVPIYTLAYIPMDPRLIPRRVRLDLAFLQRFCGETGGELFPLYDARDVKRATAHIDRALRHQYVLGFYPEPSSWDGSFQPVAVRTERRNLTVRTRRGYYADP